MVKLTYDQIHYSYMNHNYSSRKIEQDCYKSIDFMYLLEGYSVLDHSTFARFRSLHFAPCAKTIMAEMSNFLYETGKVMENHIFIDGTKIEACVNKYTFVWKKAVSKNPIQHSIETLEEYLKKLKEYTKKIYTCSKRNSYSKIDNYATFMRMKEDAMKNG